MIDMDYLIQRERAQRALAEAAANPGIALLHTQMADHFLRKINDATISSAPLLHIVGR